MRPNSYRFLYTSGATLLGFIPVIVLFSLLAPQLFKLDNLHMLVWKYKKEIAYTLETIPDILDNNNNKSGAFISDPDHILTTNTKKQINSIVDMLKQDKFIRVAVVVVNTVKTDDFDQFSSELFKRCHTRTPDKGVLIFYSVNQNMLRIEAGHAIRGELSDFVCSEIIRTSMLPSFEKGNYNKGLLDGVVDLAQTLSSNSFFRDRNWIEYKRSNLTWWQIYLWLNIAVVWFLLFILLVKLACGDGLRTSNYYIISKHSEQFGFNLLFLPLTLVYWLILVIINVDIPKRAVYCPTCKKKMYLVGNKRPYLNNVALLEDSLGSIYHDLYRCNTCNKVEVKSFINTLSPYMPCPACAARTYSLKSTSVVRAPTPDRPGIGVDHMVCENCMFKRDTEFALPSLADSSSPSSTSNFGSIEPGDPGDD